MVIIQPVNAFHPGKNLKIGILAFLVVAALSHCGEPIIHAQEHTLSHQKVEVITHAASVSALKAEFERSGFPFRSRALKCAGRDFLWITIDKGSGGYLIHGFLYKVHGESPRLVLHILPASDRVAMEPKADKQRINILERKKQTPKDTRVIAQYYLTD